MSDHALEAEHHEHPNYMAIFWILGALTMLEIWMSYWHWMPGILLGLGLILVAIVKAVFVALYYMHLKFETMLIYIIATVPIVLFFILLLAARWDVVGYASGY